MEQRFDELGVDDGMWAEFARPYHRMLLEAAQDPYKRQTGWMTRTLPLTLPSGRILIPVYSDGFNASLMAISDDDGATWRASSPIVGLGPIQPAVVRKRNGSLVAYCRDSGSSASSRPGVAFERRWRVMVAGGGLRHPQSRFKFGRTGSQRWEVGDGWK